jgi:hypothetical protein
MALTLICRTGPKRAQVDSVHPIIFFHQLHDWAISPTFLNSGPFLVFSPDYLYVALRGVMPGIAYNNFHTVRVDSPNSRENDVRGGVEKGM